MLNNPLYIAMAVSAVILLLVVIYFLSKKPKQNTESKKIETESDSQKEDQEALQKIQEESSQEKKSETPQDGYNHTLSGSEEGDFGSAKEAPKKEHIPQVLKKRDVPQHGKITKQNFNEFSGERVLVAEDNIINQKVITGLLAGTGIEIVMANDGQEALDILEEDDNFLMVLMDAHMPRVDGFEATRIIRANPKYDHVLVVALSGDTAADDIKKMKKAGMAEQLEKPLRMEALYEIFYAYTGVDNSNQSDEDMIEVISTKNIDGVKGLEICGGDENFYHEILDEFTKNYGSSQEKLGNLLESGELEHADRMLLDIIGITANIGADPLNKITIKIKEALQNPEDKNYLIFIPRYKKDLENLLADIKDFR